MNRFKSTLIALSIALAGNAQAEEFTFQGVTWGAGEAQVKAAETTAPRSEGGVGDVRILAFSSKLQGQDATALYRFAGGKLFQISHILNAKGRSCADILPLYQAAVKELTTKFGNGVESELEGVKPCNREQRWSAPTTTARAKVSTGSHLTDFEVVYSSEGVQFDLQRK